MYRTKRLSLNRTSNNAPLTLLISKYSSGGIFDEEKPHLKSAFNLAVRAIRETPSIALIGDSQSISKNDAFNVTDTVCELFSRGVVGIFGPNSARVSSYVQPLCDKMEIPHIETHWDTKRDHYLDCLVNVHPNPRQLSR